MDIKNYLKCDGCGKFIGRGDYEYINELGLIKNYCKKCGKKMKQYGFYLRPLDNNHHQTKGE